MIIKILIFYILLINNYQLLFTKEEVGRQLTINNSQLLLITGVWGLGTGVWGLGSGVWGLRNGSEDSELTTPNSKLIAQLDSTNTSEIDTLKPKPFDEFVSEVPISKKRFEPAKSPTVAVLLSLVIPGAGQFYNESYWKVPLFLGATGVLTYLVIDNHNQYKDRQSKYDNPDISEPEKIFYKSMKEGYRDLRDQDAFYLVGVYILAAIDAYVGAHLYDFNVSDDLTLKLQTGYVNSFRIGISLNW